MVEIRPLTPDDLMALRDAPLFSNLEDAELEAVAGTGTIRRYAHTALLFSAGDPAEAFYAVVQGHVHLFALNEDGDHSLLTLVSRGETFAEAALFGAGRFPVNAEVQADTVLVRFDGAAFMKALRDNQALGFRMLDSLLARQVFLIHEIRRLKAHNPTERAGVLSAQSDRVQNLARPRQIACAQAAYRQPYRDRAGKPVPRSASSGRGRCRV